MENIFNKCLDRKLEQNYNKSILKRHIGKAGDYMYYNLRKMRKIKGFTCDYMAKKIGLANKSMYSKRELGKTPFSLEEARKISELFNSSIDVIFFESKVS